MAVAFQNTSGMQNGVDVTSLTYSMTVSAGSDLALVVGVSIELTARDVTGVTFNGDAMTQVGSDTPSGDSFAEAQLFQLVNPDVVTGNVVVTLNTTGRVISGAYSMTGVDQTTPTGTAATDVSVSDTTASTTVGSVGTDDLVVDILSADAEVTVTAGADQGDNDMQNSIAPGSVTGAMSTQAGSAGGVMSWTWTGARPMAQIAVAIKPSAGAAASVTGMLIGGGSIFPGIFSRIRVQ